MTSSETWRPIPGHEGDYEASDQGRIRSWRHKEGRRKRPTILAPSFTPTGYGGVSLSFGDGIIARKKQHNVHLLVAKTFLGPKPTPLHECDHINGDPSDNRAENLEWVTREENIRRRNERKGWGCYRRRVCVLPRWTRSEENACLGLGLA
jgi:hypothetical protein